MNATRSTRRGMTLLEVIVALTVAGAALAAGASVLGFLVDQQARTGATELASDNAVRATIRDWLSASRLTTEGDAEFRGARITSGGDSEISFVTSASTEVAGGDAGTHVRMFLQRADTAAVKGLVAELTPWRRPGAPVLVQLAPSATHFHARYLSSVFGQRTWQDSWVSTSVLPAAVEIVIEVDQRAVPSQQLLTLPITIPIGARR